jgi:hypothetical protein
MSSPSKTKRRLHISIEKDEAGFYVGRCKVLPCASTHPGEVRPEVEGDDGKSDLAHHAQMGWAGRVRDFLA